MTAADLDVTAAGGVTVLGNLSVDYVDGGGATAGGCPSFAGVALAPLSDRARIVVRAAAADLPLFSDMRRRSNDVRIDVLPAATTSSFALDYDGDTRTMTVLRIGPTWTPADIRAAAVASRWVHVAPLLRSDFPVEAVAALAAAGHFVSYDGQGLVRSPTLGVLTTDRNFDRTLLQHIHVLNISEDEAAGLFSDAATAAAVRGVRELLVTRGTDGCDLYLGGERTHVPIAWLVRGVHATGAGDMFTVSYVVGRSRGLEPAVAAATASRFVAEQLQLRLRLPGTPPPTP